MRASQRNRVIITRRVLGCMYIRFNGVSFGSGFIGFICPCFTHIIEEFKLVKISSNVPRETRFTNNLGVSFLVCFDESPHQKVLKGSSLC